MDLSTNLLTALSASLIQPTPQSSPVLMRKVTEPKGTITFKNGNRQDVFSSKFTLNDIKIILGTDNFNIIEKSDTICFKTNINEIIFECKKILFN